MPESKVGKARVKALVAQAHNLSQQDHHSQTAWLTSAQHVIQLAFPSVYNPYYEAAREQINTARISPRDVVLGMATLLTRLLEEIEGGLLTTIENHAIAVTFDDFLDHGAEYLKRGREDEVAVIAGVVFKDTIRRICRVKGITEDTGKNAPLDKLFTELERADVLLDRRLGAPAPPPH